MLGPHPPPLGFGRSPTPLMLAVARPFFQRPPPPPLALLDEPRDWTVYSDMNSAKKPRPIGPMVINTRRTTAAKCFSSSMNPNVSTVWGRLKSLLLRADDGEPGSSEQHESPPTTLPSGAIVLRGILLVVPSWA